MICFYCYVRGRIPKPAPTKNVEQGPYHGPRLTCVVMVCPLHGSAHPLGSAASPLWFCCVPCWYVPCWFRCVFCRVLLRRLVFSVVSPSGFCCVWCPLKISAAALAGFCCVPCWVHSPAPDPAFINFFDERPGTCIPDSDS